MSNTTIDLKNITVGTKKIETTVGGSNITFYLLPSDCVNMYPTAYRGKKDNNEQIDINARYTTEHNLTNGSSTVGADTYVEAWKNNVLNLVLHGYHLNLNINTPKSDNTEYPNIGCIADSSYFAHYYFTIVLAAKNFGATTETTPILTQLATTNKASTSLDFLDNGNYYFGGLGIVPAAQTMSTTVIKEAAETLAREYVIGAEFYSYVVDITDLELIYPIKTDDIGTGQIVNRTLGEASITDNKIVPETITNNSIKKGTITTNEIAEHTICSSNLGRIISTVSTDISTKANNITVGLKQSASNNDGLGITISSPYTNYSHKIVSETNKDTDPTGVYIGDIDNPTYFQDGRPMASNLTCGSTTFPVYFSKGKITECAVSSSATRSNALVRIDPDGSSYFGKYLYLKSNTDNSSNKLEANSSNELVVNNDIVLDAGNYYNYAVSTTMASSMKKLLTLDSGFQANAACTIGKYNLGTNWLTTAYSTALLTLERGKSSYGTSGVVFAVSDTTLSLHSKYSSYDQYKNISTFAASMNFSAYAISGTKLTATNLWSSSLKENTNLYRNALIMYANGDAVGNYPAGITHNGLELNIFNSRANSNVTVTGSGTKITLIDSSLTTTLKKLKCNTLSVSGNTALSGTLTVSKGVTGASFNTTSDFRLKENINEVLPNYDILQLPVVNFDYKNGSKNNIGCIAQDLQQIDPSLVIEDENGMLNVKESKLVYKLLLAVKQLKTELEDIKKNIA